MSNMSSGPKDRIYPLDGVAELVRQAAKEEERIEFLRQLREKQRKECIETAIAFRVIHDEGIVLTVQWLLFGCARLTVGKGWVQFEWFYDFDNREAAIEAMRVWEPGKEVIGYTRKMDGNGDIQSIKNIDDE